MPDGTSAFGVDHGTVSKSFRMPGSFSGGAAKLGSAIKKPVSALGARTGNAVAGLSKPMGQSAGRSIARGNLKAASGKIQMGRDLKTAGNKMAANPGKTGSAVVGAGGLGAYGMTRNKQPQRRF